MSTSKKSLVSQNDEKISDIVFRDDQERHCNAILGILRKFGFALDNSALGSGKTYTMMKLFQILKLKHLVYIGTLSMLGEIRKIFKQHSIPAKHLITFQSLRSVKGKQPKHKLLTRHDDVDEEGTKTETYFKTTPEFRKLIEEGVLLVVDEIQYVRNDDSLQCAALAKMEKAIIESKGDSKVIELSGLPGGREKYYLNMLNRFRIIKDTRLSVTRKETGNVDLLGAQDLINFCRKLDPDVTARILSEHPFQGRNATEVCFELYNSLVQHHITDSMPPPKSKSIIDCKNGYYKMEANDALHLTKAINKLNSASGFNSTSEDFTRTTCWSLVTKSLRQIEVSKINIFISNAIRDLEENPKCKVCLGFNYIISVKLAAKALEQYGVLVLRGKIPGNKRQPIIDKFNEHSTKYRVLVAIIKVVNCSIRLDDKYGDMPRRVYASSSYYFIECHQFTRRFNRGRETKSDVRFRFVYGDLASRENTILDALSRHTDVCIKTSKKQVDSGIKFPGQYEDERVKHFIAESHYDIGKVLKKLTSEQKEEIPPIKAIKKEVKVIPISISEGEEEESSSSEDEENFPPRPQPKMIASPVSEREFYAG